VFGSHFSGDVVKGGMGHASGTKIEISNAIRLPFPLQIQQEEENKERDVLLFHLVQSIGKFSNLFDIIRDK
jgi:hypothetical protein